MTITALPVRNEYTSTPAQAIFNYTFKIFESTDLNVYVTPSGQAQDDATDLTTAYTVTGEGDEDGGSITLTTPASAGDLVTIVSSIPDSRTTDYQTNGDFRPTTVNADFDRVVSLTKQINDRAGRALSFQESTQNATELTMPDPQALSFVRWKADQSGMENVDPVDTDTIVQSDFVERVTNMLGLINIVSPDTDKVYQVLGFFFTAPQSNTRGGGEFVWQENLNKNLANGGTIIDPDNIGGFDGTTATLVAYLAAQGAGVGSGCWVSDSDGSTVHPDSFGSVVDDITKNVTNYAAVRSALAAALYQPVGGAPGLEGQRTLSFGVGEYFITGNSPLAFTRTELEALPGNYRFRRGMNYRGHGRSSSIITMVSDNTAPIWVYSNLDAAYPGDTSSMDNMTFKGITFRGVTSAGDKVPNEQVANSKTSGFYWESYGWEKFVNFFDCNFEFLDTAFDISGFGNADHNRWFGCAFNSIRDTVFSIDNNQSVATTFTGCDMENIYGDCFLIGPTGGGDITWNSGSVALWPEVDSLGVELVTQRLKGFINWDNSGTLAGPTNGPGNGKFRFNGLRFEVYSASQAFVRAVRTDATPYGGIQPTFDDCEMVVLADSTPSHLPPVVDYPLFVIGNTATVTLNRCNLSQYGTYEVTKFDSRLIFDKCRYLNEVPMVSPFDLLSGKCSITTSEGSITCRGLQTQLETVVGVYINTTSSDFNLGYNFRNSSAIVSQVKHQLQGWPQIGRVASLKVYFPVGSLIKSLLVYKPAETIAAPIADFGYEVKDSAAAVLVPSVAGLEDREITMQLALATPYKVPASPNNFITVDAVGSASSQLFLDKSGYVVAEYL